MNHPKEMNRNEEDANRNFERVTDIEMELHFDSESDDVVRSVKWADMMDENYAEHDTTFPPCLSENSTSTPAGARR